MTSVHVIIQTFQVAFQQMAIGPVCESDTKLTELVCERTLQGCRYSQQLVKSMVSNARMQGISFFAPWNTPEPVVVRIHAPYGCTLLMLLLMDARSLQIHAFKDSQGFTLPWNRYCLLVHVRFAECVCRYKTMRK